jgi:hypothetical protein
MNILRYLGEQTERGANVIKFQYLDMNINTTRNNLLILPTSSNDLNGVLAKQSLAQLQR